MKSEKTAKLKLFKKWGAGSFLPFLSGFVVAINLSQLVWVNPDYQAHWGKVIFAVFLGLVVFPSISWTVDD